MEGTTFTGMKAPDWADYELIDCGNGEKLERFGKYVLIRPEPQALWDKKLSEPEWRSTAHARYVPQGSNAGDWERYKEMRLFWNVNFKQGGLDLNFQLKFTAFKHVGIFPEQSANWLYLYDFLKKVNVGQPRVLNLFAYTGGASLAAKAAGADVVHLDSVKQVVGWARENMALSGQSDIRWIVEDALKFVQREQKRGRTYHAIIMDPPSYGLGPKGERWKLEENLNEMMKTVLDLLDPANHCFIINTYSLNLSALILKNIAENKLGPQHNAELGELYLESRQGQQLPLGSFYRSIKL